MCRPAHVKFAREARDSCGKQGLHETIGIERLQILDIFSDTDIFDRYAEFFLNADDDAAFGCAVEFGQDDPVDIGGLLEHPCLLQSVLSRGRI